MPIRDAAAVAVRREARNGLRAQMLGEVSQFGAVAGAVLMVLAAQPAAAQNADWTGQNSKDWTDPGNWSTGNEPTTSNRVRIDTTAPNSQGAVVGVSGVVNATSGELRVGNTGTGKLTVQKGSTLTSSSFARVGEIAGSTGEATTTGGSTWTINNAQGLGLIVANQFNTTGKLTISDGGTVDASSFSGLTVIGNESGAKGTLIIESGGTLKTGANGGFIGGHTTNTTGNGKVTVTGRNSLWSIDGDLTIGNGGTGTLTIEDRGKVAVAGTTTVANAGASTGTLNINSNGVLETVSLTGGAGTRQVNFDNATLRASAEPTNDFISGFSDGELNIKRGGLTLDDGGLVLDIGSPLSGRGKLTKTGSGGVLFDANNSFSGGLTVKEGMALAGTSSSAFGTGLLTVNGGATANLSEFDTTVGGLAGAGDVRLDPGTLTLDQDIDTVFSGVISQSGGLIKNGDGRLNLTGDNTYSGDTTINGGILAVNGSIVSDVTVNGVGTLAGTGLVDANVLNRGIVAPGNSIGDLTITGDYVGQGGILEIESKLAGNASPTDRLVLDGGSASGSTGVEVINLNGPGALTSGNGIQVVAAENGATTTGSAFSLAGPVAAGIYQYELRRGSGSAEAQQSWYLASHCDDCPGPTPGPSPGPTPGPTPLFRPEASAYAVLPAMARAQSLAALGTFHERNGDRGGDQGLVRGKSNDRAWGRIFAQRSEQHHEGLLTARFDGDVSGLQVGLDALRFTTPSGYETAAGLFFAYAHSEGDAYGHNLGLPDNFAGKPELDGASVGAYWTRVSPSGAYVDAVAMATHYDSSGKSTNMIEIDADGTGLMASLEAGYPIALGWWGLTLEPQAQAIYQHLAFDRANDPFSTIDFDTPDAVVGRLGLRLTGAFGNWRPYLKANIWQDWVDADTALYAGTHTVDSEHASTALELGGGVVANLGPRWGLWADAAYTQDISGEEREQVRGTAGLRVLW